MKAVLTTAETGLDLGNLPLAHVSRGDLGPPDFTRITWQTCACLCLLSLLFLWLSHRPLWHTDLWGHLSYGRWIYEHRQLPTTEPLLPLARGVPMVDTAWLSQVLGDQLFRRVGVTSIQAFYAASITLCSGMLVMAVRRLTHSLMAGLVAGAIFGSLNFQQLLIVRPQLIGLVLFIAMYLMTTCLRWRSWFWASVPLLFVLWANLHGSVIVGLLLLASSCVGQGLDVLRQTRSVQSVIKDHQIRRLLLLFGLSAAATLLNPYAFRLHTGIWSIASNSNLQDIVEWQPLTWRMSQGKAAAAAAVLLAIAWVFSPRRIGSTEMLLVVGLGIASLQSSRMILWWAPVVACSLATHLAAISRTDRSFAEQTSRPGRWWMAISVGCMILCLVSSPFGQRLLWGNPPTSEQTADQFRRSVSPETPVRLAAHLRMSPPEGLVLNTFEWGDYLLWAGPRNLQLFVASHVHLIPRQGWSDYLAVIRADVHWRALLDRYGVSTLILDRRRHRSLISRIEAMPGEWHKTYADERALVLVRDHL